MAVMPQAANRTSTALKAPVPTAKETWSPTATTSLTPSQVGRSSGGADTVAVMRVAVSGM